MADFLKGYSAQWSVTRVDQGTWADSGDVPGVREASITRGCDNDVRLLETGTLTIDASPGASLEPGWMRLYMTVDGSERIPMATLLYEQDGRSTEKGASVVTAQGRSVLQPAADATLLMVTGQGFVAGGSDGAAWAGSVLSKCTPAPVSVEGSFTLNDDVNFQQGCTCLEAVWQVLDAGGWCIQIDGTGGVHVRQLPTEPSLELGGANAGLLIPGVDDDLSIIEVPNRYIAVDGDERAVAENIDPTSPTGYQQRGRWVDRYDESPTLVNGESLEAYARRKLDELSEVTRTYSYTREFWPDVVPYSLVHATMAENGVEGLLRVTSQELACGKGVTVTESAGDSANAWRDGSGLLARTVSQMVDRSVARVMKSASQSRQATYMGRDGEGVPWVTVAGEESARPAQSMTVEASAGDTVSVTITGNRLSIVGNVSNPGAGVAGVQRAQSAAAGAQQTADKASDDAGRAISFASAARAAATDARAAAESAQSEASFAAENASNALASADTAYGAAKQALADAASVAKSAEDARESAASAAQSASEAVESADKAQRGLSEVEKVVGTLNWIAEHGRYVSAAGTTFDPERVYYTRSDEVYELTQDTAIDLQKTYYTRSGSGTEADPYVYTEVQSPDVEDIGTYYELASATYTVVAEPVAADIASYFYLVVDDSVQQYIASHLWLDSAGLNLSVDGTNGWRIHQGTVDGTKTLGTYVIDPNGRVESSFTAGSVSFYDGLGDNAANVIANFGGSGATIGKSGDSQVVVNSSVVEMLRNGVSFLKAWVEDSIAMIRLGREANDHILLTGSAFSCVRSDGTIGAYIGSMSDSATQTTVTDTKPVSAAMTKIISGTTYTAFSLSMKPVSTSFPSSSIIFKNAQGSSVASSITGTLWSESGYGAIGWVVLLSGSIPSGAATVSIMYQSTSEPPRYVLGSSTVGPEGLGDFSMTEGLNTSATGHASHSEGELTSASGNYSHAEGYKSTASAWYSHAEGNGTTASGAGGSHAEGNYTVASGSVSHAEGAGSVASAAYSHAQNYETVSASQYQTALGKYNVPDANDTYAAIIGNGTSDASRSNALAVRWNGVVDEGTQAVPGSIVPVGSIIDYAGTSVPNGYLECDGSAVSRTAYPLLFAAIGTAWGAGNGSTTFNLPNLNGRTVIGAGTADATGATNHTVGQRDGEETHALTTAQMPSHVHTVPKHGHGHNISVGQHNAAGCSRTGDVKISNHGHTITQPAFNTPNHTHTMQNAGAHELGYQTGQRASGNVNTRVGPYNASTSGVTKITSASAHKHTVDSSGGGVACSRTTNVAISDHGHTITQPTFNTPVLTHSVSGGVTEKDAFDTDSRGSGTAHNNMQPYAVVRKIIRAV